MHLLEITLRNFLRRTYYTSWLPCPIEQLVLIEGWCLLIHYHYMGPMLNHVLINMPGLRLSPITSTSLFSVRARLGANYGVIDVNLCQVIGGTNTNCKRIKRGIEKWFWVEKGEEKNRKMILVGNEVKKSWLLSSTKV